MRHCFAVLLVLTCGLAGGCVESTFSLAHGSPLPQGLRADEEAQQVAATSSHIELWFYTYDPPRLKFYRFRNVVLTREAETHRNQNADEEADFFVTFNGVESPVVHVARPNIIRVADE